MKTKMIIITLFGVLLLTACAPASPSVPTPDVALIQTSAAQTVVAKFTLTAASWTATPLPPPSETPTPLVLDTPTLGTITVPTLAGGTAGATQIALCDRYTWDDATVDVNIPDGTQMTPGQQFVKTWKIKNAGTCTWGAGYKVVYAGYATTMSGVPQPINGVIGPGQEVEISVQFTAPTKIGEYVSAWTLQNPAGRNFFGNGAKPLYVKIVVKL